MKSKNEQLMVSLLWLLFHYYIQMFVKNHNFPESNLIHLQEILIEFLTIHTHHSQYSLSLDSKYYFIPKRTDSR